MPRELALRFLTFRWKRIISLGFSIMILSSVWGQSYDTLPATKIDLQEINVAGAKINQFESVGKSMSETGMLTIDEVSKLLPSVSLVNRGMYAQEPVVRGLSADRLSSTVDGMHMYGACTDKMDPVSSYIETENMSHIRLQTGSSGLEYGSALGTGINYGLVTPSFSTDPKLSLRADLGYGTVASTLKTAVQTKYSRKNVASFVSFTRRAQDSYRAGNGEVIPFTQYEKYNLYVALSVRLGKKSVLRLKSLGDDAYDIGYAGLPMDVSEAKARMFSAEYMYFPEGRVKKLGARVYTNKVDHIMDDTKRPFVPMHMDMPGRNATTGGYLEADFALKKHKFKTKVDAHYSEFSAEMIMYPNGGGTPMYMETWPLSEKIQYGIYLLDKVPIGKRSVLSFSGRADVVNLVMISEFGQKQLEVFGFEEHANTEYWLFSGNSTYEYKLKKVTFAGTVSYSERAPGLSEVYGYYLYNARDGYDYLGNPLLKKESALKKELSVQYSAKRISLSSALYHSQIYDYIYASNQDELYVMTIGASGVRMYDNFDNASLWGAEAGAVVKISSALEYVTSATYVAGAVLSSDPYPGLSPLRTMHSLQYTYKNLRVGVEAEYVSAKSDFNTDAGEFATDAYTIYATRIQYEKALKKFKLIGKTGVENLLDTEYYSADDWSRMPRPGRNVYISLAVRANRSDN